MSEWAWLALAHARVSAEAEMLRNEVAALRKELDELKSAAKPAKKAS